MRRLSHTMWVEGYTSTTISYGGKLPITKPNMTQTPPPVKYDKNQIYTLEEFERLNCWLKTHELVVDGTAVTGFELDPTAKLITVPPVPVRKEVAVMEIGRQVCQWNILARQNGVVTSSQGGFSLPPDQEATLVTGAGLIIRAPDVAFTPKETYRNLTQEQLLTFRGEPFHPSFIVEVDDVGTPSKLADLTAKIKNEYFPAGIELGLLVDPVNRTIYTFKRTKLGNVRRVNRGWSDIPCDPCLPRFVLTVWLIDDAASQVCYFWFSCSFYKCKAFNSLFYLTTEFI